MRARTGYGGAYVHVRFGLIVSRVADVGRDLVTAIRDGQNDEETDDPVVPWDELPIYGDRRGMPWWGAVVLAFGLALLGAGMNLQMEDSLGILFQGCYFVGSVAAVAAVRRRNLFGPMVQPPLVLGITVPAVVLLGSGLPENSDTLAKALAIGTPLINGFPTMAITTGVTVAVGIFRLYRERDPEAPVKVRSAGKRASKPAAKKPKDPKARKEATAAKASGKPGQRQKAHAPKGKTASTEDRPDGPRRGEGRGRPAAGRSAEPTRRPRHEDPRRARPAERDDDAAGGRAPREPGARSPRQPGRPRAERRPREDSAPDSPRAGRPRRTPPRGDGPRGGAPDAPRRGPAQGGRPARGRPWDDEPPPRSGR